MPREHSHVSALRATARPDRVPVVRVSGPAALVQAVPYLIGFHPSDSLVLVGLSDGILVVTARLDLGPAGCGGDLTHAVGVLLDGGVTDVVAVIYDVDPREPGVRAAVTLLDGLVEMGAARLLDTLSVSRGRWRSVDCDDESCCPPGGKAVDDHTSEFAAAATFAGMVPHADRGSLAAILKPDERESRMQLRALIDAAWTELIDRRASIGTRGDSRARRALFAAARAVDGPLRPVELSPPDAHLARLGAWLADIAVRDSVWMAVDDGRLDGRPLWALLARRLPEPYDAAPAFLYGWAAWREGNGAMALVAAGRALDADPGYTAADLLLAALSRGVDPRAFPKLRRARG